MTATDVSIQEPAGLAGEDRLTIEASKLRSRRSIPLDRWLQLIGAVLPLLGLLAILAGWYGVSHTAREWRQTPYLVSGAALGLGLIFLGGFAYFSYWMTKLVEQGRHQTAVLLRIEDRLAGRSTGSSWFGAGDDDGALVVDAGGVVHRSDCPLLAGRSDVRPMPGPTTVGDAPACPVCEPVLPAPAPAPTG